MPRRRDKGPQKKRKGLYGAKKVVDCSDYSEHLAEFRNSYVKEIDVGPEERMLVSTVTFDDEVVSRLDVEKMLDNLSEEEELYGAHVFRRETLDPDDPGLTRRARNRALNVAKGRKTPLARDEVNGYHDAMKEGAIEASSELEAKIKRDYRRIRTVGPNKTKRVAAGGEDPKKRSEGASVAMEALYF